MKSFKITSIALKTKFDQQIEFDNLSTLVSSVNNTEGKTTLLRAIVFALGFDVNTISDGVDSANPIATLNFVVSSEKGNTKYTFIREFNKSKTLQVNFEGKFLTLNLDSESDKSFISDIFGIEDFSIFAMILGAFYIDQEFGWSVINHGRIHPNIDLRFDFPQLFAILNDFEGNHDLLTIESKLDELNKIKKITSLFIDNNDFDNKTFNFEARETSLKIKELNVEIFELSQKIKQRRQISVDFLDFMRIIETQPLLSQFFNEEKVKVLKDFHNFEVKLSDEEIGDLIKRKAFLQEKVDLLLEQESKQIDIFTGKTISDSFAAFSHVIKQLQNYNKNEIINSMDFVTKEIDRLRTLKERFNNNNKEKMIDVFSKAEEYITTMTNTDVNITLNDLFSLKQLSTFNKLSGVKKSILVLFTRVIILKLIAKKYGIIFPIIIDTISSSDPSDLSTHNLLRLISEHKGQIIIANVNKGINSQIKNSIVGIQEFLVEAPFKSAEKENVSGQLSLEDIKLT